MPEWLQNSAQTVYVPVLTAVYNLTVALVLGCIVAGVYRLTYGKKRQTAGLMATLVLLTVLICLVTMVIGNDVARAFSLVGALAIVRFRTVVEDTRDTAFVIFAVAIGMAVGAGPNYYLVALISIPFAAAAAFLFRTREVQTTQVPLEYTLKVRFGVGPAPDSVLHEVFGKHLETWRLTAAGTARQGAALDLTYNVRLRRDDGLVALVTELNGVKGVQEIEMRQS